MAKISKEDAAYRHSGTMTRRCGTCSMFRQPDSCTAVEGKIYQDDICKLWAAKAVSDVGGKSGYQSDQG